MKKPFGTKNIGSQKNPLSLRKWGVLQSKHRYQMFVLKLSGKYKNDNQH